MIRTYRATHWFTGGSHPDTLGAWETQHRPQLLEAFGEHVYGHPLPAPDDMTFDVTDLGATDEGRSGRRSSSK
ncbi:hypothetical protein HX744_03555 [Pseudonocardia sp. ICBG1122]|nr:hypothetical protein [Pseudonocardia pini]